MNEIDATWFQHLLHPGFAPFPRAAKRTLVVVVGLAFATAAVSPLAVLAVLVCGDGGPAFFMRRRTGE